MRRMIVWACVSTCLTVFAVRARATISHLCLRMVRLQPLPAGMLSDLAQVEMNGLHRVHERGLLLLALHEGLERRVEEPVLEPVVVREFPVDLFDPEESIVVEQAVDFRLTLLAVLAVCIVIPAILHPLALWSLVSISTGITLLLVLYLLSKGK